MKRRMTLEGDDEVGRWLAALHDSRRRTLAALKGVGDDELDSLDGNSIGSLLYHVAAIEADWLYSDILGAESGEPWPEALFPVDVRDDAGELSRLTGVSLDEHLRRLEAVRELFVRFVGVMGADEFRRVRVREDYEVSAEWVVHHLLQHEAEHRAEIAAARRR